MRYLALLCLFVLGTAALAQPSMAPPAEIRKLDWMLGTWEGSFNWDMEGTKSVATMKMVIDIDGQFQRQVTTMEMSGMKITETAYLGWNAEKKKYGMYTFTNFSPEPRIEWGDEKNGEMIFFSEPWNSGMPEKTSSRATLKKLNDKEVSMVLEFRAGDKWTKVADGTFKKTK